MERNMRLVLLASLACCVVADMNDVVLPFYTPPSECLQGCAPWNNLNSTMNQLLWAAGKNSSKVCSYISLLSYISIIVSLCSNQSVPVLTVFFAFPFTFSFRFPAEGRWELLCYPSSQRGRGEV